MDTEKIKWAEWWAVDKDTIMCTGCKTIFPMSLIKQNGILAVPVCPKCNAQMVGVLEPNPAD